MQPTLNTRAASGETAPIHFAHKGKCHTALEEIHDTHGWSSLYQLPDFLQHNLGLIEGATE